MPDERSDRRNYVVLLGQGTSNTSGYQLTSEKLVLPFLYSTLGAPIFFAGLLVPIVTVSNLFIQVFAAPLIAAARQSKWYIALSALFWALSLVLVTTTVNGVGVIWVIPIFILVSVVLGASMGVNSLATQNLVGQILDHHHRSRLLFTQSSLAGLFAVAITLMARSILPPQTSNAAHLELIWLGIGLILLSSVVAIAIREPPNDLPPTDKNAKYGFKQPIDDFRDSLKIAFSLSWFPRFLIARTLFLSIELSTPFFAVHAASFHANSTDGLSTFVIASSLGLVIGGVVWPRVCKDSVRLILVLGASMACLGGLLAMAIELQITPQSVYFYAVVFILISLGTQATQSGRRLYVMGVTTDAQRPACIAISNILVGLVTIAFGAILGALAGFQGVAWPIVVLIVLNVASAIYSLTLKNVQPTSA